MHYTTGYGINIITAEPFTKEELEGVISRRSLDVLEEPSLWPDDFNNNKKEEKSDS
jgi:hypothetical protein